MACHYINAFLFKFGYLVNIYVLNQIEKQNIFTVGLCSLYDENCLCSSLARKQAKE